MDVDLLPQGAVPARPATIRHRPASAGARAQKARVSHVETAQRPNDAAGNFEAWWPPDHETGPLASMNAPRPSPLAFRQRFADREALLGTFIKTTTSHAVEIVGGLGFDFVVIDEEHAPFDRNATDIALLAARAAGTAGIVRVPSDAPEAILSVLDSGAVGVLVPHVSSTEKARRIAAASRYRGGSRGFSASPRAGGYGSVKMWDHVEAADRTTTVIAMIEDPSALDEIDAIVGVEGIDGVFIGRGDLTVAFGAPNRDAPVIREAVAKIIAAATRAAKPVCVMVDGIAEAKDFHAQGASAFIVSSDQGFLKKAAVQTLGDFADLKGQS
jgi:2-keto-3-deoxy-L-rhamnonate aldolase RhmA